MTSEMGEHLATANEFALRLDLWASHGLKLADRAALRRFAAAEPARFAASFAAFTGLEDDPSPLRPPPGRRRRDQTELLAVRRPGGTRAALRPDFSPVPGAPPLPVPLARDLEAAWPRVRLMQALAVLLLDADLRPDDRVVVAGLPAWPWLAALHQGIALVLAEDARPDTLASIAREEGANVVAAPASWLAQAGLDCGMDGLISLPGEAMSATWSDAPCSVS